jgi:hypothetical protein
MSTMHFRNAVSEPDEVACEAEEGNMMCRLLWLDITTDCDSENEGFLIAAICGVRPPLPMPVPEPVSSGIASSPGGVGAVEDSSDEKGERAGMC